MTHLMKFGKMPSLVSDFFDDDPFFNFDVNRSVLTKFGNGFLTRIPAANVKESNTEFAIELGVPGKQKRDFHIEVENGNLNIWSEKKEEKKEKEKGFTKHEFSYNSFSRVFKLPENILIDKIKAQYENGILKVTVPKKTEQPKQTKKEVKIA